METKDIKLELDWCELESIAIFNDQNESIAKFILCAPDTIITDAQDAIAEWLLENTEGIKKIIGGSCKEIFNTEDGSPGQ